MPLSEIQAELAPQSESGQYLTNFVMLPELFSPQECRRIIYANIPASQAHVVRFDKSKAGEQTSVNDLQMHSRNTKVKSVPQHETYMWMYQRVIQAIKLVNDRCFRFQIRRLTDLQILEYENTGFYGTHIDVGTGETSRRKISMVLFLTPPQEYSGGELILKPWFTPVAQNQGSAVFFPSYIPHEITPVTQGVRHSLVTWVLGPSFR